MFPPQLARFIIEWLTSPGDVVYDPFSGRGTTPLEANLINRRALASDANPLAVALTKPKTSIPSYDQVAFRLRTLRDKYVAEDIDISSEPDDIRMLYSDNTLRQIVYLKSQLRREDPVDALLTAVTLGMLHANHSAAGATAGFSISMPNTFAMSPGYVRRYIAEHGLTRPDVNVFSMIQAKVDRLGLGARPVAGGAAWRQDATAPPPRSLKAAPAKLILTSPPYLEVIKYGKYNWIRLWFLDETPRNVDAVLMSSSSLSKYLAFMDKVLIQLRKVLADDGYLCLVIGDVRRNDTYLNLAQYVWDEIASPHGWHLHGIIEDHLPTIHKVSRIWKNNAGRATKIDRLLIMSPNKTHLPKPIALTWERPSLP